MNAVPVYPNRRLSLQTRPKRTSECISVCTHARVCIVRDSARNLAHTQDFHLYSRASYKVVCAYVAHSTHSSGLERFT